MKWWYTSLLSYSDYVLEDLSLIFHLGRSNLCGRIRRLPPDICKKRKQRGKGPVSPVKAGQGIPAWLRLTPSRWSGLTQEAKEAHAGQEAKTRMVGDITASFGSLETL